MNLELGYEPQVAEMMYERGNERAVAVTKPERRRSTAEYQGSARGTEGPMHVPRRSATEYLQQPGGALQGREAGEYL